VALISLLLLKGFIYLVCLYNCVSGGNNLIKNGLAIGIVILFIISSVTPMVIGIDVETTDTELDKMLDNLRFVCTDANGFSEERYEYYKEQLLSQHSSESSNDDITVEPEEELTTSVELPIKAVSVGPMDSAWPMKCHDVRHTGRSPYSTADTCAEKWRFKCDWVEGGSVIGDDGTIYFGDFDDYLYALHPNGTLKWKYKTDSWIWSSPAIAEDGTIYVGSYDCGLYAINPNGTKKWRFGSGGSISSSPATAEDGTIYLGTMSSGNSILAVNPNGTEKWRYTTGYSIVSDPAIGDDGTVYIGSGDTYFYAMNPNGTLKWRYKTGDIIKAHPSIADDGTIYIASFDHYLYALYPNGTLKWKRGSGYSGCSSVAIGEDGTLYFGGDKLYAAYPNNGTTKWSFELGDRHISHASPAISADGIIYIGVEIGNGAGGEIIAVNSDGTERWQKKIANKWVDSSPSIGDDGTVYIGTTEGVGEGGYLYAFGVGELEADANGPYYGLIDEPLQFTGSHWGGYSPHSYHWDFGDTHTSEEQNPTHIYTDAGNYTVTLTVTDDSGNTSDDATWAWIQETNAPPGKPNIDGPTSGNAGTSYDYTFEAIDPDGSVIWYFIDWGDNTDTGWLGPYDSGEQITESYTWSSQGTYTIKAKAKDPYGEEGPWGYLDVTMPVNQNIQINSQQSSTTLFFQILQRLLNIR